MPEEIPQEQLERIRPTLDRVLSAFHQIELKIPLETGSALTYGFDSKEEE